MRYSKVWYINFFKVLIKVSIYLPFYPFSNFNSIPLKYSVIFLNKYALLTFRPQFPKEETIEEVIPEDDSEVLQEQIEDELMARDSDEDEENLLNIDDLYAVNNVSVEVFTDFFFK